MNLEDYKKLVNFLEDEISEMYRKLKGTSFAPHKKDVPNDLMISEGLSRCMKRIISFKRKTSKPLQP